MPSTATLSHPARPARAEANTYGLPRGEKLRRAIVTVFRQQRQAILRYMRTGRKDLHEPIPTDWPDWGDFHLGALAVSQRMTPILSLTWDAAATKFAPRVGLDPNEWEVVNPHTERMIAGAALDFCQSTNETTSLSLDEALTKTREELHAGIVEKGEALPKLTKRINAIFDGAEKWRARRIAQTETSRAVHAAQEQAAIASGVVTGWAWLLSSDACPLCQTIARRAPAVRLGHAFAVIGDSHAYSQVRMPPAHPHCNCSAIEVLDTDIQPAWSDTLHQPQPEETDLTGPATVPFSPQPAPVSKPAETPKPAAIGHTTPGVFRLPARSPVPPTPAEPIGEHLPSDEEIAKPKKPKPPKAPPKPKKPKLPPFPDDPGGLQDVRALGGSTGAKLVKDPATGKEYVFKTGANAGHLREEAIADSLYRALGVDVPRSQIYEQPTGPVKLSEFHVGKTLGVLEHSDPAAYAEAVKKLRKGFVADAILGNWDVIGASADNVLVTDKGQVLRIDNGGSLRYRAMGSKKSASQFGPSVSELSSLRDSGINPAAAKVFSGITDDEIKAQIKAITRAKARLLAAAPDELKETLGKRIDSLKDFGKAPKPIKVGNWKPTPESEFFRPKTLAEAQSWATKHYDGWDKQLTKQEKEAVREYTSSGYGAINRWLRNPGSPHPGSGTADTVAALDRALNKRPTPEGIIAYRQFNLSSLGLDRSQLRPGQDLTDTGFTSTTLKPGGVWSGDKFEVRIPKGTPGGWVNAAGSYSSHPSENEFLLGREADTLRIIEVKPDIIVVEVVRPTKAKKPKP